MGEGYRLEDCAKCQHHLETDEDRVKCGYPDQIRKKAIFGYKNRIEVLMGILEENRDIWLTSTDLFDR